MTDADPSHLPTLWRTLSETPVADCRVFKVVSQRAQNPRTGCEGEFFVIKAFDWVVALAATAVGEYLMVNQYRFGSQALSWEFPAGCLDPGEEPVAAAARELREETGFEPLGEGRVIGKFLPNPALQDNTCWIVLFDKVTDTGKTDWDPFEEMEIKRLPLEEIVKMAKDGRITHGMAHAALFFLIEELKTR